MAAQEEEDAAEGAESVETRSMNAIAELPQHQQVRAHPHLAFHQSVLLEDNVCVQAFTAVSGLTYVLL